MTVTLKEHDPPAARVPPDRAIVRGAVLVTVPPHPAAEPPVTASPAGMTSVNATPVRSTLPTAVLARVNSSTDVSPLTMGSLPKDLASMGAGGALKQPVKTMSSKSRFAPLWSLLAPVAVNRKTVLPVVLVRPLKSYVWLVIAASGDAIVCTGS